MSVATAAAYIERMAHEFGIDPEAVRPTRTTNKPPPPSTVKALEAIISEYGGARSRGVDEDTARHEAAHAAVAYALGWKVTSADAVIGLTNVIAPDIQSQSLSERNLQRAVIAAAGAAFTGVSSSRAGLEGDRFAVRLRGATSWEKAREKAERLVKHSYVKPLYERLTAALLEHARLSGDELRRVLEGD